MKLKLTIALVILALVLGFVLTACDDGELPTLTNKEKNISGSDVETDLVLDKGDKDYVPPYDNSYVPFIDGNKKPGDSGYGTIEGKTGDTTGLEAPELEDLFADPADWL